MLFVILNVSFLNKCFNIVFNTAQSEYVMARYFRCISELEPGPPGVCLYSDADEGRAEIRSYHLLLTRVASIPLCSCAPELRRRGANVTKTPQDSVEC